MFGWLVICLFVCLSLTRRLWAAEIELKTTKETVLKARQGIAGIARSTIEHVYVLVTTRKRSTRKKTTEHGRPVA